MRGSALVTHIHVANGVVMLPFLLMIVLHAVFHGLFHGMKVYLAFGHMGLLIKPHDSKGVALDYNTAKPTSSFSIYYFSNLCVGLVQ